MKRSVQDNELWRADTMEDLPPLAEHRVVVTFILIRTGFGDVSERYCRYRNVRQKKYYYRTVWITNTWIIFNLINTTDCNLWSICKR